MTKNNVTFKEIADPISGDVATYVFIDHADGSYTSMLKSTYEAQQAEQSTPIVTADE
jgi:hypothetical protein